ncbi:TIGR04255 family protein [Hungatella hathewayi]|uniref:TIGR04255 family protein n=1 Tax=Hungatella hathewayi TaxID=154046 RepID=UPI003561E28D
MDTKSISRASFKYNFLKQVIIRLDFQGVLQAEMENILLKVKPYLKERKFNRYEQKINNEIDFEVNNGIFESNNPVKEIRNVIIHSFINEDCGYAIDLSTNYICLKVNAVKYISFEEYSKTFMDIANIYKTTIDFLTLKRFGLRKINFCFVNSVSCINKYFTQRYFDCYDLFGSSEVFACEKKENFSIDNCKMNVLCDIEQGMLGNKQIYKVTLDSDIYIDVTETIEKIIFEKNDMAKLNDKLFSIYADALTEEFGSMLLNDKTVWPDEIIGVEKNE